MTQPAPKAEGRTVTIYDPQTGRSAELPVLEGTAGPPVIDIRALYQELGMFTYDPGYGATGSCESAITFIDGEAGELRHRGYAIEDLARHCDHLEVCHLLLYGDLPERSELAAFDDAITYHTMVHEQIRSVYQGFRRDAHPMAIMCGVVGALSAFYQEAHEQEDDRRAREIASHRLIAKMPTIAAMAYKYAMGQPFMYPRNELSYARNFLHMTFTTPCEETEISDSMAEAMNRILILHADHEQNASTSTVRLAGSSGANPFACIASGIASLWGPAHGGANEAVVTMLEAIGTKDRIPEFVARAKDREDPFRLMGFGHRVYKNYDPRAAVLRESAHEVLADMGLTGDPLFELALELEDFALNDPYFQDKRLFPNVDFYSGIILRALGFPLSMFTAIFATARVAGWISQLNEMLEGPNLRIGRPRQLYTGPGPRDFVPLERR